MPINLELTLPRRDDTFQADMVLREESDRAGINQVPH